MSACGFVASVILWVFDVSPVTPISSVNRLNPDHLGTAFATHSNFQPIATDSRATSIWTWGL